MSWEGDLSAALGKLKRAAIDAKMCGRRGFFDDGRLTESAWNRESGSYYIGELGSVAQFLRCTRPDTKGEGGGLIDAHPGAGSHFVDNDVTSITWNFQQVRNAVDDTVRP